jgi:hypothetical protein
VIGLAPAWLVFMFGWHIAMVNLGIGLAWLVPLLLFQRNFRPLGRLA